VFNLYILLIKSPTETKPQDFRIGNMKFKNY
jgi:hypothetical protein